MLARNTPAHGDTLIEDFVARQQHALDLVGILVVEEQDGVNITITRVENVGNPQVVPLTDGRDEAENVRQPGTWNNAILGAVGRAQTSNRSECRFAALPYGDIFRLLTSAPGDRSTDGSAA